MKIFVQKSGAGDERDFRLAAGCFVYKFVDKILTSVTANKYEIVKLQLIYKFIDKILIS